MWKSQVGKTLKHCLQNEDKREKARWGSRLNQWIFEFVSELFSAHFSLLSCVALSSSFFKSLLDRHTARYVKQTYCILFKLCFPGSLLSYIAFLAKNSQAVKHLHLPSAHSLPLQAVWVFYGQRACYLWAIISIQDKQLLWHTEMQCSLQVHENYSNPVLCLEGISPRMSIWLPCFASKRYCWIMANGARQNERVEGVDQQISSTSAWCQLSRQFLLRFSPQTGSFQTTTPHQSHQSLDKQSGPIHWKSMGTSWPSPTICVMPPSQMHWLTFKPGLKSRTSP